MYAARHNRIRLRITLSLMIAAVILGAMISLQVAHLQLSQMNELSQNNPQIAGESTDWVETLSALGEEVIQLFINLTSETR